MSGTLSFVRIGWIDFFFIYLQSEYEIYYSLGNVHSSTKKNLEKVFPDVYEYNITHVKIYISQNEISMYHILSNIPFKVELFFWIIRNSSFYTFLHLKSLPFSV